MALSDPNTDLEELSFKRRAFIWAVLTLPLLLSLLGFVLSQMRLPDLPAPPQEEVPRGNIIALDGTILAEGAFNARRYPQGNLAAQLIGFSGLQQPDGRYGLEGFELTLDAFLQRGQDVTITIDTPLQAAAQAELRRTATEYEAESGALVMLESGTGRVLAAASYPEFDPNLQRSGEGMTNRAFLQHIEPGSTFKPFVVAALLESGRLTPQEIMDVGMTLRVGGHTFRDVAQHESRLSAADILRYSSNVGTIQLANRLSSQELHAWLDHFGFGRDVGLQYSYTRNGSVRHWDHWVPQDHASVSIGHSFATTALQLATAYSVFANQGRLITPQIIESIDDHEIIPDAQQVLSPWVSQAVLDMMTYTIEESGLRRAKIPGIRVAGKTGTADAYDHLSGSYLRGEYMLAFAGIFPADDPRITAVVFLHRPQKGNSSALIAAPILRVVGGEAVALWGIPPEREDRLGHAGSSQ